MVKLNSLSYLKEILDLLEQEYPLARTSLCYHNPFQLLLAVILSAQTTDKQVNKITEKLFKRIKIPQDILDMGLAELEEELKRCGLYHQKSRQIMETSRLLIERYNGEVPGSMDELLTLPGVGRKTANVVLSTAFGIPAFAVDTHVRRVSQRLGWTCEQDVRAVEDELCRLIPRELWGETHHRLIEHGRRFCRAKKPLCSSCPLSPSYCPFEPE
jgi:endonuclease III